MKQIEVNKVVKKNSIELLVMFRFQYSVFKITFDKSE